MFEVERVTSGYIGVTSGYTGGWCLLHIAFHTTVAVDSGATEIEVDVVRSLRKRLL